MTPRPSSFHEAVIKFIHAERGPFSLKQIRDATGIKDPKTSRVIINRLAAMKYVTYLTEKHLYGNKRWVVTRKWPLVTESPKVVMDDYNLAEVLRRMM